MFCRSAEHLATAHGLEGVFDVLNGGRAAIVGPHDGHDIEPAGLVEQFVALEEVERGQREPALFLDRDRLRGRSLASSLHLDDDHCRAIARHQIDFAVRSAIPAHQDAHPFAPQVASRRPLSSVAEKPVQKSPHDWIHEL
jgi:hypothetical protein